MKKLEKIIEYALYLFVFLLPWQTRLILRPGNLNGYSEYGTISIYATEILLWFIFLLAAVWWAVRRLKTKNEELNLDFKNNKLFWLVLLFFVVYSLASIFWSESKTVALEAVLRLAEGVGLFLVLRGTKFDATKLAWAFVGSAVIQAGLGVWQFLTQSTFASKWLGMAYHDSAVSGTFVVETAFRRWLRAYGSLPHPNMLAGFLSVGLLIAVWLYQKTEYGLKKILLPVFFAILSLGLFTTFSKSAMVALGVAALFLWAVAFLKKQTKETKITLLKFTLIFLVVAVIFSGVFWEPVSGRIGGDGRLEIKSTSERLSYAAEAWQIVKVHPIFGIGLGNYTLAVHNEINPNLQSWDYQPVHNIYLLILVEMGIIGFILWLTLVFCITKKLSVTRYSLLIILLIIGLFDHYFWTFYFGVILFWLVFGLAQKPLDKSFDKT